MKLAVVGGGSTYTPELVSGLSRERERVPVDELVLHDIDPERRTVVGEMAARMLEKQGFRGTLTVTDELDAAVSGASFVLLQLRVGGQSARLRDETIPLACDAGRISYVHQLGLTREQLRRWFDKQLRGRKAAQVTGLPGIRYAKD